MPKSPDRLIVVGAIAGAHGVRGDVRVKSFTEDPEALFSYGPLLSSKGEIVLEVKSHKPAKTHFIVTPKTRRQKEEWDDLKGTQLHVPRESLPEAGDDEFYIEDLVGLKAVDLQDVELGAVKAVFDHGAGDLLEILTVEDEIVLVPFTLEDVPALDISAGWVRIADISAWIADDQASSETGSSPR